MPMSRRTMLAGSAAAVTVPVLAALSTPRAAAWPVCQPGRAPAQTAATAATVPLIIQNNTGSDTVYAFVTGQAIDNGNALMLLQSDGHTPYFPASPASPVPARGRLRHPAQRLRRRPGHHHRPAPSRRPAVAVHRRADHLPAQPRPRARRAVRHQPLRPQHRPAWDFCEFTYNQAQLFANLTSSTSRASRSR